MHNDMMVGAFSHSTAVGKLRKDLPDVPVDARVMFPRYSLKEAEAVSHYYLRFVQKISSIVHSRLFCFATLKLSLLCLGIFHIQSVRSNHQH